MRPGLGALALILIAGCQQEAAIGSCGESLAGVWRGTDGREWAVLDSGARLEAYPQWPDNELPPGAPADLEVAPRVIDLQRDGVAIHGSVHRRFMRGDKPCDAIVPIRVRGCRGTLELELADPPAPTAFSPCALPSIAPPQPTTWTRVGMLR